MKIIRWLSDNILFIITIFLLAFIPLYPKLPLLDIKNTWVYIRLEDVVVLLVLGLWVLLLIKRKVSLKTPLTMPIMLFWVIGAIATIHGMLLIFPTMANVFPNVAFLSYLRRIEYLSLFFVAYAGMKDKKFLQYIIATIAITLLLVVGYGIGQRYLGFPAFLTMNEEFAKGEPIRLSELSRVPSTFAGHYDLAAYLVLVLPILTSLIFGFKKWFVKVLLLVMVALGFLLMFMTVSRVSFFVLFISLGIVLLFQKKKVVLLSLPIVTVVTLLFLSFTPALLDRFGNTIQEVDVLVDATTGEAIGHAKEVPSEHFKDKLIIRDYTLLQNEAEGVQITDDQEALIATTSADTENATSEAVPLSPFVDYTLLPAKVTLLVPMNTPTGENLPQGTGYINLSLSPVTKKLGEYYYEQTKETDDPNVADVIIIHGNYIVKRAAAYDLSFTTRFQGEWPHAMQAFMRSILFGSGYGSISLAIDNNYFRILGEVGLLGTLAFVAIFVATGIFIKRILPDVDSPIVKSFVLGYAAGVIGLALNAIFIDVFEASKVAYVLWLLTGVTLGILSLYQKQEIRLLKEFKKFATSPFAVIAYLGVIVLFVYSPMLSNYFVGDDFTWFRWAAECQNGNALGQCGVNVSSLVNYFTQADGFFYRPGTKVYFSLMYSVFWLNQTVYHIVSLLLHFIVASLVFLLLKKVLRDYTFAVLAAFLFVLLSGYSEALFWISSTGYLFTTMFALSSVLFFGKWDETKNKLYFALSLLSLVLGLLFHELGVVTPLLILLYKSFTDTSFHYRKILHKSYAILLGFPLILYGIMRFAASSHWSGGDYSYNVLKLPFNIVGNAVGYILLSLFGPITLSVNQLLRSNFKENLLVTAFIVLLLGSIIVFVYRVVEKRIGREEKKVLLFGAGIFIIGLLPFLGLGNITSRYSYMSSIGIVLLIAFFIKKIYEYLQSQGKDIALTTVSVFITIFILLQLMQIQQIQNDWRTAGNKAERFIVAIDEKYAEYWATEPMDFYFVNVPIKTGEAWIFPVGLEDALWFSFRNPSMRIHYVPTVDQTLQIVTNNRNQKVFEFDPSGKIIEHRKEFNEL